MLLSTQQFPCCFVYDFLSKVENNEIYCVFFTFYIFGSWIWNAGKITSSLVDCIENKMTSINFPCILLLCWWKTPLASVTSERTESTESSGKSLQSKRESWSNVTPRRLTRRSGNRAPAGIPDPRYFCQPVVYPTTPTASAQKIGRSNEKFARHVQEKTKGEDE